MKRVVTIFFAGLLLAATLPSCKKCYKCNFNGDVREYCSKDFPDGTAGLNITIDGYEKQGYVCDKQ